MLGDETKGEPTEPPSADTDSAFRIPPGLGLGEMAGLDKLELAEIPDRHMSPTRCIPGDASELLPLAPPLPTPSPSPDLLRRDGLADDDDPLESRRRIEPGRRNEERVVRESALVGLLCASALASSWSTSAAISS